MVNSGYSQHTMRKDEGIESIQETVQARDMIKKQKENRTIEIRENQRAKCIR